MITFGTLIVDDFRVLKHATVPLEEQGLVLIRAVNEDTLAADSNGSGKTTVLHGFGWTLFGKLVGEERPTDIIRRGAKKAVASLDWREAGTHYKVRRIQKRASQVLELFVDDVPETGRTRQNTQDRIEELLGLDFDSFRNTVMYGQGDFKRFASPHVTDADRKKVMKRALNLTSLDRALKRVRAELKECREREHEASTFLTASRVTHSRAQADLCDAQEEHGAWRGNHDTALAAAQARRDDVEAGRKPLEEQADKVKKWEALEAKAQKVIDGRSSVEQELRAHAAKAIPLEGRITEMTATESRLKSLARDARRDAAEARRDADRSKAAAEAIRDEACNLKDLSVCPTCRTPTADSSHTQEHLVHLEAKAKTHDDLAQLHLEKAQEHDEAEEALDADHASVSDRLAKAWEALKQHDAAGEQFTTEMERIDAFKPKLAKVRRLLVVARKAKADLAELDGALAVAQGEVQRLEGEINPHTKALARAEKAAEEALGVTKRHEAEVAAIGAEMVPLRFWERGFSNKGLPSMALDAVLPIVTESANRYLHVLSDGDIQVDIQPQRELKAGGKRDEIDINVRIEGHNGVRPSGAQESKISIAIDLALMDLVATREGASLDILLIDEVMDGLDSEGKRRVFELLEHLREHRSTIIVISHDDTIKERFETVWTVTKAGGAATLETE